MTNGRRDGAIKLPSIHGHHTLEELVYRTLRTQVSTGEIRPGQRISINDAAQQLGVSRLPVIHALRRLASEGFVVIHPHREAIAADPSPEDVRGRYLIIAALEGLAGREALQHLDGSTISQMRQAHARFRTAYSQQRASLERLIESDANFHALLWKASGIRQLEDLLRMLWDQGGSNRALFPQFFRAQFADDRIREHERIVAAIEARDSGELSDALYAHRIRGLDRLVAILEERPTGGA
jgi:DNA-binding GntR family transcriptional regulator